MFERILHWFWKMTRLDIECEYYCGTCPYYEKCCQGEEVYPETIPYKRAA